MPEHLPDGPLALLLPRAEAQQVPPHQHQQPRQRVHQSQHLRREQVCVKSWKIVSTRQGSTLDRHSFFVDTDPAAFLNADPDLASF